MIDLCERCQENGRGEIPAVGHCWACNQYLCDDCWGEPEVNGYSDCCYFCT